MVDVHLVHECDVELVQHERFGDVPRHLRVPDHGRDVAPPEPFVGRKELVGEADCERGDDVERERVRAIFARFLFFPLGMALELLESPVEPDRLRPQASGPGTPGAAVGCVGRSPSITGFASSMTFFNSLETLK